MKAIGAFAVIIATVSLAMLPNYRLIAQLKQADEIAKTNKPYVPEPLGTNSDGNTNYNGAGFYIQPHSSQKIVLPTNVMMIYGATSDFIFVSLRQSASFHTNSQNPAARRLGYDVLKAISEIEHTATNHTVSNIPAMRK
jgi:hypothetical protein